MKGSFVDISQTITLGKRVPAEQAVGLLRLVAAQHRRCNKHKKSHHAAGIVFGNYLVGCTVSINDGLEHAEVRALRRFLATPLSWCVKQG